MVRRGVVLLRKGAVKRSNNTALIVSQVRRRLFIVEKKSRCKIHLQLYQCLKYRAHYSNSRDTQTPFLRTVFQIPLKSRPCLKFQLPPEIHPSSPCDSCNVNESHRCHNINRNFYLVVFINTSIATKLSDTFKNYQPEFQILYYIALNL